jgi:hypothetical protein
MPRLKPCPKCHANVDGPGKVWSSIKYKSLECPKCRLVVESTSRDAAAREWNRLADLGRTVRVLAAREKRS